MHDSLKPFDILKNSLVQKTQVGSSLARRMVLFALVAVGIYAIIDTAVRLAIQYRHDMATLGHQVENLVASHRTTLSMSLYRLDENQLRAQLRGLIGHLGILRLEVTEPTSTHASAYAEGEVGDRQTVTFTDTLYMQDAGETRMLGLLTTQVDARWPMQELKRGALMALFGHLLSLGLLALIIVALTHFGVTRHLLDITDQLESIGFDRLERRIILKRLLKHRKPDEIDRLGDSLNGLLQRLEEGRRELDEEITKRQETEKRQEASRKLQSLGNLAGGIAHDINNILGIILLQVEMARDMLESGSTVANKLGIVIQAVDRAKEVVRQVLVFSRSSDGNRRPQNVTLAVKDSLVLLRSTAPKNITMRTELEPDCGLLSAEPADIQQILLNLGVNAFQAIGQKTGSLVIHLRLVHLEPGELPDAPDARPGLHAMLTVTDSGPGMEKTVLDRIFEPYFTTKEAGKGTGLGLAMVHGIVAKLGGQILVHSEVGRGTTFRILLPVEEGALDKPAPAQPVPHGRGEHILLVEDEPLLRSAMQQILEGLGYRVTPCSDGLLALKQLQKAPARFDLLLTDLSMPGMGGTDLSEAALNLRPDLPIAVCTGFANPGDLDRLQVRGIQIVAGKPFLRSELALAVRAVLDGARDVVPTNEV
jgi:signal transduction histidine kinase